jgi:hypothetical protein
MSDWSSAFTHAFRSLRRQPTFALIALATLALGIANTTISASSRRWCSTRCPTRRPSASWCCGR